MVSLSDHSMPGLKKEESAQNSRASGRRQVVLGHLDLISYDFLSRVVFAQLKGFQWEDLGC